MLAREAHYRAAWEASVEAMALSDADGTVLAANPAYCDLYGLDRDDVVGRPFCIIFPSEQREWAMAEYRRVFGGEVDPQGVESVVQRSDGTERYVDVRYSFVEQEGERVAMLSLIRDVTERARLQDAERNLARQKDDFLLAVSHDLRTPVTTILGYTQVLQRRLRKAESVDPSEVARELEHVVAAATRL